MMQSFFQFLSGTSAEFSDPKFPAYAEGREGGLATALLADMEAATVFSILTDAHLPACPTPPLPPAALQ